jgi:hypothetical protein
MSTKLSLEMDTGADGKPAKVGISVGIEIADGEGSRVAGSVLLITKCSSCEDLEKEVAGVKGELDALVEQSRKVFEAPGAGEEMPGLDEDMSPQEIWKILADIKNEDVLLKEFNSLSREKRFEVADYVLTQCNVFSGAGSIFSMRYNRDEGILE